MSSTTCLGSTSDSNRTSGVGPVVTVGNDRLVATWRAMGSDVRVVVTGTAGRAFRAVDVAFERVAELETRWSRFRSSSDVSRLNSAGGREIVVSDDTIRLVTAMKFGHAATKGAFDPTLVVPLVHLGYGESLDGDGARTDVGAELDHRGSVDRILFHRRDGRWFVKAPIGTALDAGGIGKGLAADLVVETLGERVEGVLVSIGGDVAVSGRAPEGAGWYVDVLDPDKVAPISTIRLERGGVATSSTRLRRFDVDGRRRHHLIDPRTLDSIDNGVLGASVVAGTTAWAEVLTKQVMIGGRVSLTELDDLGLAAQLVDRRGVVANHHWAAFEVRSWS